MACAPSEDSDQPGHSKDSDQTGRMPRLIRVFAGRTLVILLVLSCCSSCVKKLRTGFITSLREEGSGLCASRAFVCLFLSFSLPLGVGGWLWFAIVALPGLFYYLF